VTTLTSDGESAACRRHGKGLEARKPGEFQCRGTKTLVILKKIREKFRNPGKRQLSINRI
jgi:hypothetical protein